MARQVVEMEEELGRIWRLVSELSDQTMSKDKLYTLGLDSHYADSILILEMSLMAIPEEFQSEIEQFASHLILENQQLQYENKQVNALLKEYESTLETVMGKFRGVAHASQQHDLSLHSYYTSLLQSLQTAHSSARLHDDTSLSVLLARLSTLIRSALRSVGGEETDADILSSLRLALPNGFGHSSDGSSSPSPSTSSGKKSSSSGKPRAPPRPSHFAGFQPGATGGYPGTEGHPDWALEREMEILRLEEENKALREMLAIAEEATTKEVAEEMELPAEKGPESPLAPRKSSLTVEQLEAGAEQEEAETEERKRVIEAGEIDEEALLKAQATSIVPGEGEQSPPGKSPPGTGLGGGAGVTSAQQRPQLTQSVLGFTAGMTPPEEVIEDGPETDV